MAVKLTTRDNILNIKKSDLTTLLSLLDIKDAATMANTLLEMASQRNMQLPPLIGVTTKVAKVVNKKNKTTQLENSDVVNFKSFLKIQRERLKHVRITEIEATSIHYTTLQKVVLVATAYSDKFSLDKTQGFNEFIKIGLSFMTKGFNINVFVSAQESIFELKNNQLLILNHPKREIIKQLHEAWATMLKNLTNQVKFYDEEDKEYIHFLKCYELCKKHKADFKDWVVAQFEGFSFISKVPLPEQLHSESAITRYENYIRTKNYNKKKLTNETIKPVGGKIKTYYELIN